MWLLHSAASVGYHSVVTMMQFAIQSDYPGIVRISVRLILVLSSIKQDSEKYMCVNIYSKTSLNRPTMGLILYGPFREVVGLGI